MEKESVSKERLLLMARKLYRFMMILSVPAVLLGGWLLWLQYGGGDSFKMPGWMHAKLTLVILAIGYSHACGAILKKFERGVNTRSHTWYRWFNEVPVLLLLAIVILSRMSKTCQYYFAPHSPWSYLGHERLVALAKAHGAQIDIRPFDLGKVFGVSGGLPLAKRAPQRQAYRLVELAAIFEKHGLPFAPISRPEQLLDDPHLNATGGLADITLPDGERAGQTARTTLLPLAMDGQRLGVRLQPPVLGQHTAALMQELGYTPEQVQALQQAGAVA
eukprot:gene145-202_t